MPFPSDIFPKTEGVYIIGGSIRDVLLGRTPTDYDIVVKENPADFAQKMAANRAGHVVEMGKAGQKIFRVILDRYIFDIAAINGVDIEDDLKQRDFTVNALAYDLSSKKIVDCVGGLKDLAARRIRKVSENVFKKDPIRLLRAYRMSASLAFDIDRDTASIIKNEAERIKHSAGERIRTELFKILGTMTSFDHISQMVESELLTAIFPDLYHLKGCQQNNHHAYDAFEHTLMAYQHLETMMADLRDYFSDIALPIRQAADTEKMVLLKCSILLHDIGKPCVKTVGDDGKVHFYGHAHKSADMAQKIVKRLRFATRDMRFIDFIIRNHMKPLFLFAANQKNTLKQNGLTRFFIKSGDNLPYLLLHALADAKAKQVGKTSHAFISFVEEMIHYFYQHFRPKRDKPRFITGDDLIHVFSLTPSPLFKTILNRVEEARLANRIHSRTEALNFVRKYLDNGRPTQL